jgi:predicted metal-binding membrane protein
MSTVPAFDAVLRHDRLVTIGALGIAIILAWGYLLLMPTPDNGMAGMAMMEPMAMPWSWDYALLMVGMWALMMAAMMLPGAAPTILLVAALARRQEAQGQAPMRAGVFAWGYLAVWTSFSIAAAALQWALDQMAMLTSDMAVASAMVAGLIVAVAGVYQWTPLKRACLTHCRSPIDAITHYWRAGVFGAFSAGVRHGLYCLGCCAVLMGLLFAGGIMNLAWIAGITVLVLAEKVAPGGQILSRAIGAALVIWGGVAIAFAIFN